MLEVDRQSPVVVCAADNAYAMQLAVVIRSALATLRPDRKLILFVIDGGIKPRNKTKILQGVDPGRCVVHWLQPDRSQLENVKVSGHLSAAAYLRFQIPALIPQCYDKAIYLDSDLIVNHDLTDLWEIELGDAYLLAAQEIVAPYVSSPKGLLNYQQLGLAAKAKYFNSGVLVLNLQRWREQQVTAQLMDYLSTHWDVVQFHDQDCLNAVLAHHWRELDLRWNQTPGIFSFSSWQESPFSQQVYEQALNHPYIIHFASAAKPWNSREPYPANGLFFHYVDQTPWRGWRFNYQRRFTRRLLRELKGWQKTLSAYLPISSQLS